MTVDVIQCHDVYSLDTCESGVVRVRGSSACLLGDGVSSIIVAIMIVPVKRLYR